MNKMHIDFEKYLEQYLQYYKNDTDLYNAFEYALLSGGKRIRPCLVLLLANDLGFDYRKALDIALAIEMIHSYSLVHDDLPAMDNDLYRRGKKTVHHKYNEYTAILVGDALLTEAFYVLSKADFNNVGKLIEKLSYYSGIKKLIYGQYLDMLNENNLIDEKLINEIHLNKTCALIIACFDLVLTAFNIKDEKYDKYINLALNLGLFYQIQDDFFDKDNKNDKSNYFNIIGEKKALLKLNELKNNILGNLNEGNLRNYILKIIEREK